MTIIVDYVLLRKKFILPYSDISKIEFTGVMIGGAPTIRIYPKKKILFFRSVSFDWSNPKKIKLFYKILLLAGFNGEAKIRIVSHSNTIDKLIKDVKDELKNEGGNI